MLSDATQRRHQLQHATDSCRAAAQSSRQYGEQVSRVRSAAQLARLCTSQPPGCLVDALLLLSHAAKLYDRRILTYRQTAGILRDIQPGFEDMLQETSSRRPLNRAQVCAAMHALSAVHLRPSDELQDTLYKCVAAHFARASATGRWVAWRSAKAIPSQIPTVCDSSKLPRPADDGLQCQQELLRGSPFSEAQLHSLLHSSIVWNMLGARGWEYRMESVHGSELHDIDDMDERIAQISQAELRLWMESNHDCRPDGQQHLQQALEALWVRRWQHSTVWLPGEPAPALCTATPEGGASHLQREVHSVLQAVVDVPVCQEVIIAGTAVAVDLAFEVPHSSLRVAVEVQGKHHFTAKKLEKRSSVTARLLRQHAGWHVVPVTCWQWNSCCGDLSSQRQLLRSLIQSAVEGDACCTADDRIVA